MRVYLTPKKPVFKFFFVFMLLTMSSNLFILKANWDVIERIHLLNDDLKMTVIPDPDVENQAVIALFSEMTDANFVIFNSTGNVVLEKNFKVEKDQLNTIKLDLSTLKAGTYYIVHDENNDSVTYSVK